MSQPGYDSCSGCGRLFKQDNPAEQVLLDTHNCWWSDDKLNLEIKHATVKRVMVEGNDNSEWTYANYVDALGQAYRPEGWRNGQLAFNLLWACRPDLSERIRGTKLDPFHRDDILPAFHKFIEENW